MNEPRIVIRFVPGTRRERAEDVERQLGELFRSVGYRDVESVVVSDEPLSPASVPLAKSDVFLLSALGDGDVIPKAALEAIIDHFEQVRADEQSVPADDSDPLWGPFPGAEGWAALTEDKLRGARRRLEGRFPGLTVEMSRKGRGMQGGTEWSLHWEGRPIPRGSFSALPTTLASGATPESLAALQLRGSAQATTGAKAD